MYVNVLHSCFVSHILIFCVLPLQTFPGCSTASAPEGSYGANQEHAEFYICGQKSPAGKSRVPGRFTYINLFSKKWPHKNKSTPSQHRSQSCSSHHTHPQKYAHPISVVSLHVSHYMCTMSLHVYIMFMHEEKSHLYVVHCIYISLFL